jgi:hypothetical protein
MPRSVRPNPQPDPPKRSLRLDVRLVKGAAVVGILFAQKGAEIGAATSRPSSSCAATGRTARQP